MTYDSIEIIPAKLYFKIVETGNIKLLSTENTSEEDLQRIWVQIEKDHNQLSPPNKDANKVLNLSKKIEALGAKLQSVKISIRCLTYGEDEELMNKIKEYGYQFKGDLKSDLERIDRQSEDIKIKLDKIQKRMPKIDNAGKNALSFDEAVMSYSAFTGSGFIDTNKITLTQYYSLISIGNKKIKALENNVGKR
ncbi:MAG: hypothetical protein AAF599_03415 [Bacteroidota bacterium]